MTPEEQYLASLPLWLIRAEMAANGEINSDYLIDIVQARIRANEEGRESNERL